MVELGGEVLELRFEFAFQPVEVERQIGGTARSVRMIRLGQTDDLVGALLFLLSDEAAWVTGQILAVDGGQIVRF